MEDEELPDFATPTMETWETVLAVLGKLTEYASLEAKREYRRAYKAHNERQRRASRRAQTQSGEVLSHPAARVAS